MKAATEENIRRPPGPSTPIKLGVDAATLASLEDLRSRYGNISYATTPNGRHAYFVNDPAAIHKVLVRDRSKYIKGPGFERVKLLLGNGIFVSDGDHWRRARTMVQPAFTRRHLHRLIGVITSTCETTARKWQETATRGGTLDITREMTDFALETILRAIFGADYDRYIVADGVNAFAFLSDESARDLELVVKFRALRKLVLELVERRRAEGQEEYDFLSAYVTALDKSGKPFSDRDLLDELMTLIIAGFETSAGTLNWAWYLIASNDAADRDIAREARDILPDAGSVDKDSVGMLDYLARFLNESMRLYPPGWIFTRRATEDLTLGNYDVPTGTDIYISPYILHRTEQFWQQPDVFDPERFSAERFTAAIEAAFVPFSLGPRRCIGEYFALLEMKIHIALLAQRFRLRTVAMAPPELELGVNLRSKGSIHLRPEIRSTT